MQLDRYRLATLNYFGRVQIRVGTPTKAGANITQLHYVCLFSIAPEMVVTTERETYATPEHNQIFVLIGVAITMPLIIGYTARANWVFRSKVSDEGYH